MIEQLKKCYTSLKEIKEQVLEEKQFLVFFKKWKYSKEKLRENTHRQINVLSNIKNIIEHQNEYNNKIKYSEKLEIIRIEGIIKEIEFEIDSRKDFWDLLHNIIRTMSEIIREITRKLPLPILGKVWVYLENILKAPSSIKKIPK